MYIVHILDDIVNDDDDVDDEANRLYTLFLMDTCRYYRAYKAKWGGSGTRVRPGDGKGYILVWRGGVGLVYYIGLIIVDFLAWECLR